MYPYRTSSQPLYPLHHTTSKSHHVSPPPPTTTNPHQATINTNTKIPKRSEFCIVAENPVAPPVLVVEGDCSVIGVGDPVGFSEVGVVVVSSLLSLVLVFGGEELLSLLLSLLSLVLSLEEEEDVFECVSSSSSFSLFGVSLPGPPPPPPVEAGLTAPWPVLSETSLGKAVAVAVTMCVPTLEDGEAGSGVGYFEACGSVGFAASERCVKAKGGSQSPLYHIWQPAKSGLSLVISGGMAS